MLITFLVGGGVTASNVAGLGEDGELAESEGSLKRDRWRLGSSNSATLS